MVILFDSVVLPREEFRARGTLNYTKCLLIQGECVIRFFNMNKFRVRNKECIELYTNGI